MDETRYPPEAWERLARATRRRRKELDLSQPGLDAAGGPSTSVISKIERAKSDSYEERVLIRLEDALGWRRGSVQAILEGGEPTLVDTASGAGPRETGFPLPSDLTEIIDANPDLEQVWG